MVSLFSFTKPPRCSEPDRTRPFQDTVKAGTGNIMCSYQRINNSYGCANSKTMNGLLKTELGFQVSSPSLPSTTLNSNIGRGSLYLTGVLNMPELPLL
jgi:hypothetical protein